jgi:hypothetical protein
MNRTEFLKTCAGGLCSCTALGLLAPGNLPAAETPKPEDWRFQFIKQRYAKLLENLGGRVGDQTLNEIQEFKQRANEDIAYDREKGVITVVGPERGDCFCPLIDCKYTPKTACNCSLGWQQYVYETLLGKKVQVKLKESVLHGGKRCIFEIHVSDVAV